MLATLAPRVPKLKTVAYLDVNRTITALGIVVRHAGVGLEPFVVR